ncbi:hypothetical protein FBEOM_4664 [Fusarium beomiforme]|uniref:Uncharacterized protein n=1 Tax=Fusarium beomiforme TaxID=44412 RepID=A0A9P5AMP1_9HYPO|nr:hypothetical protein FBEOM_4664 [Fusarium beomiforme]
MEYEHFGDDQGAFQIHLDAEVRDTEEMSTHATQTLSASIEEPFAVIGNPQDNTARPPAPKQGPAAASPREFKELMIQHRLDNWRARARVVHTKDQGLNMFGGFNRMWFVPFDIRTPLPAEKQETADDLEKRRHELYAAYRTKLATEKNFQTKLLKLIEEEVKETCRAQWDRDTSDSNRKPVKWNDVRAGFQLTHLVTMIAQARLADGKELLGYFQVKVLELGIDGKITYQRVNLPSNIDMEGMLSRMNSWSPSDDEQSQHAINVFRHKIETFSRRRDEMQRKMAQDPHRQLNAYLVADEPNSERYSWVFKLRLSPNSYTPAGKAPDRVHTWTQLKEATYQELLDGARVKKYPVFVRVSIIRDLR